MRPLLRQEYNASEIDKEFVASSPGMVVMTVLSVLDCLCLALAIFNSFMIYRKWSNRNALGALSLSSNSPKAREMGSQQQMTGFGYIRKNITLVSFYFFSILTLIFYLMYYLRFVQSLYNCEDIAALFHALIFLTPCIGYCQL